MHTLAGAPDWLETWTAEERPDLWEFARSERLFGVLWPEYNHHGNNSSAYFGSLVPRFAHLQVLFVDSRNGDLIARGRTIPFHWDRTTEDLPAGIDSLGLQAVNDDREPTALSALAAEVVTDYQGSGISSLVIRSMSAVAEAAGLWPLVAPVRPSWKDRYPLVDIDRYASWEREDGLPFDPWLRVHARLGGRRVRTEPRSMEIRAAVADWETWTGMRFPSDGSYVFPGGLAPLEVTGKVGEYWEPNVWMLHDVGIG
jgi:hypothetical protein